MSNGRFLPRTHSEAPNYSPWNWFLLARFIKISRAARYIACDINAHLVSKAGPVISSNFLIISLNIACVISCSPSSVCSLACECNRCAHKLGETYNGKNSYTIWMLSLLHISIAYECKHRANPVDYTSSVRTVIYWCYFIKALYCEYAYVLLYKYICNLN